MLAVLRRRYLDILASIYIYNEHRGYTCLDRVLEAVQERFPDDRIFVGEIQKHRADERKHYLMFRRYFQTLGSMPYRVDRTCGHIDRLIKLTFGCHIDDLDANAIIANDALFAKMCRIIMLTEQRGMRQIDILLESFIVRSERPLAKIFKVVERDEPSHWMPYMRWLERNHGGMPTRSERFADFLVHRSLILFKLPLLFFNPWLPRLDGWYDETELRHPAAAISAG